MARLSHAIASYPEANPGCPDCGTGMTLARVTPKAWLLPELRSYLCPACRNVVTFEVDPEGKMRLEAA